MIWLIIYVFIPLYGIDLSNDILKNLLYREIGPTRQGGRVVSIAVSSKDTYVFLVGAGPGGLWKTVNNGNTFESIFDEQNSL